MSDTRDDLLADIRRDRDAGGDDMPTSIYEVNWKVAEANRRRKSTVRILGMEARILSDADRIAALEEQVARVTRERDEAREGLGVIARMRPGAVSGKAERETARSLLLEICGDETSRPFLALSEAVNKIAAERQRQITEEGRTPRTDLDQNDPGEMAAAAAAYALNGANLLCPYNGCPIDEAPHFWPDQWDQAMWKPTIDNPLKDLVRAGALIAAEIDRLLASEGGRDNA